MLRRRQINSGAGTPRLRSTLATATGPVRGLAWAAEERLLWRVGDLLRRVGDAARWPFERLVKSPVERVVWTLERSLLWPLEERLGDWGLPLRAGLAVVAIGAGVAGLALVANGGGHSAMRPQLAAPAPTAQPLVEGSSAPTPVLEGAPPDFTPPAGTGQAEAASRHSATPAASKLEPSATASAKAGDSAAAPAALKVAHRFADAFVLYETGQTGNEVRAVFGETATPRLSQALLRRPPRLPANVKVPQAKVVNVVPGPQHGSTYTVSVSLLRVGITSELRVHMQREGSRGDWRVTDVLG